MKLSQRAQMPTVRICFIVCCLIAIQISGQFNFQPAWAQESKSLTAAEVIEKNISACGGYEVLDSITNYRVVSLATAAGQAFEYEAYRADGKYWVAYKYENGTNFYRGSLDGQVWQFYEGAMPTAIVGEERLEYLRQLKYIMPSTRYFETYEKIEMEGIETVHDRDTYVLQFFHKDGNKFKKYYDVETFMCVRKEAIEEYDKKKQHVIRDYFDYQKSGETMAAFRLSVSYDGGRIHDYEIQSIEYDVKVPKDIFKLPANLTAKAGVPLDAKAKPGAPAIRITIDGTKRDIDKTKELKAMIEEAMKQSRKDAKK